MIAIIIITLGILRAFLKGGQLSRLMDVQIRWPLLILFSFLLKATFHPLIQQHINFEPWMIMSVFAIQHLLLFIFIGLNIRKRYMWLIGMGIFLNFLVSLLNGGAMPVSRQVLEINSLAKQAHLLQIGKIPNYILIHAKTPLWFLGDIIYIPILQGQFISIGDIFLIIGILLFIQSIMLAQKPN